MAGATAPYEALGAYPIRISSGYNRTTVKACSGLIDPRLCPGPMAGNRIRALSKPRAAFQKTGNVSVFCARAGAQIRISRA